MTKADQDLHLKFDEKRAARLYLARFKLKLKQSELARDLGVSRFHIMRLEGLRKGRTMVASFDWARAQAVLGKYAQYVKTGAGAETIEHQHRIWANQLRALAESKKVR